MDPPPSWQFSSSHSSAYSLSVLRLLLLILCFCTLANSFFGGDCCCCDCCCDCCCGSCCAPPLLLAVPCCSSSYNSYGLYGGAIFGKRRRKRDGIYARTGPRSADFLNNHKCAERFWLKLVERKKKMEGRMSSTEVVHEKVPAAKSPKREYRSTDWSRLLRSG